MSGQVDPSHIMQVGMGFWASKTLLSAVELELFTKLGDGMTGSEMVNALGLHLLDYLQFHDLMSLCEQAGRWSFLCVIAPLQLSGGTGSPVNPIAIM